MKKINSNSFSIIISVIALSISFLSLYYQFIKEEHSVLYSYLLPEIKNDTKEIVVPVVFKNTGNQTELILFSHLMLEYKIKDSSYYKRISDIKPINYPIVLGPNESKLVNLTGAYKEYFWGTMQINANTQEMKYYPITKFDNLKLVISTSYLTGSGEFENQEREIGYITFNEEEIIDVIDVVPTKFNELIINTSSELVSYRMYSNIKYTGQTTIDLNDSNSVRENYDKIQLMNRILEDRRP